MGLYFVTALGANDPYPIMAWLMITATMIIIFNLIADVAYGYLDPRFAMTDQGPAARNGAVVRDTRRGRRRARERTAAPSDHDLAYEAGVEIKARSQWSYARMRFFRHKMAVARLVVLIFFAIVAIFANQIAPYGYDEIDLDNINPTTGLATPPTLEGWHIFGTDQLGRDYLSRIIYGIRTSLWVALFVAILATVIGTAVGALAGFYGGRTDNLLMRFTDLILTLPGLAVLLTAAVYLGSNDSEVSLGPIRSRSRSR